MMTRRNIGEARYSISLARTEANKNSARKCEEWKGERFAKVLVDTRRDVIKKAEMLLSASILQ